MRASGLPTALDPAEVAKNVQRAQKERAKKMAEVEAEMAKVAVRTVIRSKQTATSEAASALVPGSKATSVDGLHGERVTSTHSDARKLSVTSGIQNVRIRR